MNVESISADQLSDGLISQWESIREDNALLSSPFLSPHFTRAVAARRKHVEIGLIRATEGSSSNIQGFVPFERLNGRIGVPVGNRLNDFHGVIAAPEVTLPLTSLLQGLQLHEWRFHHQLAEQTMLAEHFFERRPSPYIDLSDGFDSYYAQRCQQHHRTFKDQRKRWRGLETQLKQLGLQPLRFVFEVGDVALLESLIDWKRQQYHRTQQPDVFAHDWTRGLVHDLAQYRSPTFGGLLSGLFAGDRPIACHFGMRTERTIHCWFPAFDTTFAKWSPGLQLWIKLIESAAERGIERIDFGSGAEGFKYKLANQQTEVAKGTATASSMRNLYRRAVHQVVSRFSAGPLRAP